MNGLNESVNWMQGMPEEDSKQGEVWTVGVVEKKRRAVASKNRLFGCEQLLLLPGMGSSLSLLAFSRLSSNHGLSFHCVRVCPLRPLRS